MIKTLSGTIRCLNARLWCGFLSIGICQRHYGGDISIKPKNRPKSRPKNLLGEELLLVISQKQEDHFRMLQEVWKRMVLEG